MANDLTTQGEALLRAAQDEGEVMAILRFDGQTITVQCQRQDDVIPLCEYVTKGVKPDERVLN